MPSEAIGVTLPLTQALDDWGDAHGVLDVQGKELDRAYLRQWATSLGLTNLFSRTLTEVGQ